MFKLGLTGGIAAGKSAVAEEFAKLGATLVDADVIARQLVEPNQPAFGELVEHFGTEILTDTETLDRRQLRQIVFNNAEEKRWLEQLLHPLIRTEIEKQLNAATGCYAILVSPLLFESAQDALVDQTLVVDIPVDLQMKRACLRDASSSELINSIIASQMPRETRAAKADRVLDNSGPFSLTLQHIHQLHAFYLSLSQ